MQIRLIVTLLFLISSFSSYAQDQKPPNFDIVVFDVQKKDDSYQINNPQIIADSSSYDNQPHFSADGKFVYFTKMEGDKTNIWRWSMQGKKAERIVKTDFSEYSPTQMPFLAQNLSMIRVEGDGTQRLWRYSEAKGFKLIFKTIKPVGYHAWNEKNIAMFVLGEPNELRVTAYGQEDSQLADSNIGRCLQAIPLTSQISYTVLKDDIHLLKSYDFEDQKITQYHQLPKGSEDYIWLNNQQIISSKGKQLLISNINNHSGWKNIENLANFELSNISRLALSSNGKKIAVVYARVAKR